jgi:hypothetical protein
VSLQDLGNIGEFVAAIATLITLIYLALQIRQNTQTLRANSVSELTENSLRAAALLLEYSEVFLRGARDYSELSSDEKFRFRQLLGPIVARFDTVLEYRERGMVDDAYVAAHAETLRRIFANRGVREWWDSKPEGFTDRVRGWLDDSSAA